MKNKLLIIGAGGHGKVVAETALLSGKFEISGFCDDQIPIDTVIFQESRIISDLAQISQVFFDYFFVAIGNNQIRKDIFSRLKQDFSPATIIHPFTSVSPHAQISPGCIILPGTVISYGASIGENCILGAHSHVDHETFIGNHSYIGSGSMIGSYCRIIDETKLPSGSALPSFTVFPKL